MTPEERAKSLVDKFVFAQCDSLITKAAKAWLKDELKDLIDEIILEEREACAKISESFSKFLEGGTANDVAQAIRARGKE